MSLLMEALRKAEEQKRKAEEDRKATLAAVGNAAPQPSGTEAQLPQSGQEPPQTQSPQESQESTNPSESSETSYPMPVATGRAQSVTTPVESESSRRSVVPPWFGRGGQGRRSQIPDVELTLEPESLSDQPADLSPGPAASKEVPAALSEESETLSVAPSAFTVVPDALPEAPVQQPETQTTEKIAFAGSTTSLDQIAPTAAPVTKPEKPRSTKTAPQTNRPTRSSLNQDTRPVIGAAAVDAGRQSARAVFAAKFNTRRQSRNQRLAVAGAVAMVAAIAVVGYLLLNLGGSGINVNIENFDPNQQLPPMDTVLEESAVDFGASEPETVTAPSGIAEVSQPPSTLTADPVVPTTEVAVAPELSPEPIVSATVDSQLTAPMVSDSVPGTPAAIASGPDTFQQPQPPAALSVPDAIADIELAVASSESTVEPAAEQIVATPAQSPVMLVRRDTRPSLDPTLISAYAAYQNGDLAGAAALYRQVLVDAPLHRDALLGLATIARLDGDVTRARELYSRLLTRDPRDPAARAGLLELAGGNPNAQERELKRLLGLHPQEPTLAFALGNLYAAQQRWPEAQQHYFDALQLARSSAPLLGGVNPDYAFNLAVSLEHLSQAQPALTYYREALALADSHPAGFDLQMLRNKLQGANQD